MFAVVVAIVAAFLTTTEGRSKSPLLDEDGGRVVNKAAGTRKKNQRNDKGGLSLISRLF